MWYIIDRINHQIIGTAMSFATAIQTMAIARRAGISADVVKAL